MISRSLILLVPVCLLGIYVSAQTGKNLPDPVTAEMRSFERLLTPHSTLASDNYDVTYYRCEWSVDPAVRFIKGKVTVVFKITKTASSISLDLMNGLTVDSVKQRNNTVLFIHQDNVININISSALNTPDSISIFYQGVPPNTGFGSFIQTVHAGVPVMWTLSEPYGSRDWWPCKNGLDDKADSIDIYIQHPSVYTAASNGLLQEKTNVVDQTITHWKHRYQIASYLICFAVTNYAEFSNTVALSTGNLLMQTFCYPENLPAFQQNTPMVLNQLKFYDNTFGPYPFAKEKYGHVQFSWGGGMEHQTSTFIIRPDEGLMAHELAHQWFGDKVTCASWRHIWLNEGFATHLASMYMETQYPQTTIATRKSEIANITSSIGGSVWVDDTTNVSRIFSSRLSYTKGSHLMYMLRAILGDDIFLKGLKMYLNDPKLAFGYALTEDLQRNLEAASGRDLTYFFQQWFYGQGYPSYKVEWANASGNYVKIKMNQITSHPSVSFFQLPVTLLFKNATQQKAVVVDNKANGEVFYRNIGFKADTVIVDPEAWLITANNVSTKQADIFSDENSLSVYPNPVSDKIFIEISNYGSGIIAAQLFAADGKLVYSNNFSVSAYDFFQIPVQNLLKGNYIIKLYSGTDLKFVKKLIKH
ncbi:M1 family aminopeptidase [soil metagenome]